MMTPNHPPPWLSGTRLRNTVTGEQAHYTGRWCAGERDGGFVLVMLDVQPCQFAAQNPTLVEAYWDVADCELADLRVIEGGTITHIVKVENDVYACMLGGPNLTTLFLATSAHTRDKGRIEFVEVDIPKAGLP